MTSLSGKCQGKSEKKERIRKRKGRKKEMKKGRETLFDYFNQSFLYKEHLNRYFALQKY